MSGSRKASVGDVHLRKDQEKFARGSAIIFKCWVRPWFVEGLRLLFLAAPHGGWVGLVRRSTKEFRAEVIIEPLKPQTPNTTNSTSPCLLVKQAQGILEVAVDAVREVLHE